MTVRSTGQVMAILLLQVSILALAGAVATAEAPLDRSIKRFDPVQGDLVTVQEPIPEKIYNHYSDRLSRRVWAFARSDGNFSHAMGEGSTQNIKHFDFPYSTEQQQAIIAEVAPRWARSMQYVGSEAYVRLDSEQTWKLVQHLTVPSLFDLETMRRWEWHGQRRVAVGHTGGYRWRVVNGRYLPERGYSYGVVSTPMGCHSCRRAGSAY
jgi:hypothetical protein